MLNRAAVGRPPAGRWAEAADELESQTGGGLPVGDNGLRSAATDGVAFSPAILVVVLEWRASRTVSATNEGHRVACCARLDFDLTVTDVRVT